MMVSMAPAAQAASNGNTVVRVGFPIQHGISYLDENGDYSGYMVDYLEYLSLYTNWDYEFVNIGVQGVQTRLKRNVRFESK